MKLIFDEKFDHFMEIHISMMRHKVMDWFHYNHSFVESGVPTVHYKTGKPLECDDEFRTLNSFEVCLPGVFPSYYLLNYLGWYYKQPQEFSFDEDSKNPAEDKNNIMFVLFDHNKRNYVEVSMPTFGDIMDFVVVQTASHYQDYLKLVFSLKTLHELDHMEGDSRLFIDGKLEELKLFPYTKKFKISPLASSYIADAQYKLEAEYTKYED